MWRLSRVLSSHNVATSSAFQFSGVVSLGVFSSYSGATLKFPQLSQCFGSQEFSVLAETSRGHFKEVFIPLLSTLLLRINKPREFKHEVAQVGAGARGDRQEEGLLHVVTIQSAAGTDFWLGNGGNNDRTIVNGKVSNILVRKKVLCFHTDKVAGAVVCLY